LIALSQFASIFLLKGRVAAVHRHIRGTLYTALARTDQLKGIHGMKIHRVFKTLPESTRRAPTTSASGNVSVFNSGFARGQKVYTQPAIRTGQYDRLGKKMRSGLVRRGDRIES